MDFILHYGFLKIIPALAQISHPWHIFGYYFK